MKQELLDKIEKREAVVGILGLGYVGLPLVIRFLEVGYKVIGFDVDPVKIEKLSKGQSYLKHIPVDPVLAAAAERRFSATNDFSRISDIDAVVICVPTPLGVHHEPDLSYVKGTIDSILPYLRKGQMVSLESTTYPGTTDEEILPPIEAKGFTVGDDIFVVYSPEREDPGNPNFRTQTIPKVVGGISEACTEIGTALYSSIVDRVVPVSCTKVAEMTKLLENIYRAVNIGLVNEMKMVADKMGIDIWEVIDAASTKPFGFTPFYPGPGLGGHCIPIDPFYLTWKAREYGIHTRFIELAGEINTSMPAWVVSKVIKALNGHGKSIKDAKVLVLGVAYKKNVDDMRESPSVEIIEDLLDQGADVIYADPYVPVIPPMRRHDLDMKSVVLDDKQLEAADCVVIATDHDDFDYEDITSKAKLVVDSRGRIRNGGDNIVFA